MIYRQSQTRWKNFWQRVYEYRTLFSVSYGFVGQTDTIMQVND